MITLLSLSFVIPFMFSTILGRRYVSSTWPYCQGEFSCRGCHQPGERE
jgi:hypothetical protein